MLKKNAGIAFLSEAKPRARVAYAMDFYEVAESDAGYKYHRHAKLFEAMKTRQADELVLALLRGIVNVKGVSVLLLTDEAR